MPSAKLTALVSLAVGQVPTDLAYVVDVSAGAAGSKSSTLNDLFSFPTRNITDGAQRFQGFAAPAVSAAGQGAIYFDSTANAFRVSENAGAYRAIGDVVGPAGATANGIARYDSTTGKLIKDSIVTVSDAGAFAFPDDVRQVFNPGATVAGLNTGALAGDPSTPINGDLWYDSAGNLLRARVNGATISLGAATPPGGANTQVQFNNAAAFGGVSGFTSDGTNVTAGSGNLRATSPRITTAILDTNGNELFNLTATGSAVNEFTVANAATAGNPTLSATGSDAVINITVSPKSTGFLESTGPLRLSGTGVDQFVTPVGSSVPTKINIPLFNPGGFGQILAMGLNSAAASTARVITIADQRGGGHQASIALLSPDELNIFGLSWDGSNTIAYLINTTGDIGVQGRFRVESGGVALAIFDNTANAYFGNGIVNAVPANYIIQATGGSGTNIAGASLDLAGGKGTGNAAPGIVGVRYPLIGASGTTLQSLSTDRFPVQTNFYLNYSTTTTVTNTTTETGLLGAADQGTDTIQAGLARVGRLFKLSFRGSLEGAAAAVTIRLKLGGTTIVTIPVNVTTGATLWELDIFAAVTAVGATGNIRVFESGLLFSTSGTGAAQLFSGGPTNTTVDFTANQQWSLTAQWAAAAATSIFTYDFGNIDIVR